MNTIVSDIIMTFNEYLVKVPAGCVYIEEQLRTDNLKTGLDTIKDFSEGLLWMIEVVESLRKNGVNIEFDLNAITEFLLEINEALMNNDIYLVADLFAYEIKPYFEMLEPINY